MQGQYVAILTTLLVLCTTGHEIKLWNERNCPSTYNVYSSEGKPVGIELRSDPDAGCQTIVTNRRNRKELSDLKPIIKAVFKNGQYVANISWQYAVKGNKKLPKQFLLNMSFYEEYMDKESGTKQYKYSNVTCVNLMLANGRRVFKKRDRRQSTNVKFYFDCVPLQGPEIIGLQAEVWTFPQKSSRGCRSVRSLPDGSQRCGMPGIQCSPPYSFGVARDAHKYRQCECYRQYHGEPNFTWQRDSQSKRFKITVTNMPPYLKSPVELEVFSHDKKDVDIFREYLEPRNGSLDVYVYKAWLTEGSNFDVYVRVNATLHAECQDPGASERAYKQEILDECNSGGYMFVRSHMKFEAESADDVNEETEWNPTYVIAIVTALLLTTVITSVCFVVYNRKSCKAPSSSSNNEIEMTPLRQTQSHIGQHSENIETHLVDQQKQAVIETQERLGQYSVEATDKALVQDTSFYNVLDKTVDHRNEIAQHNIDIEEYVKHVPAVCILCQNDANCNKVEQLTSILQQKVKLGIVKIEPNGQTKNEKYLCNSNNVILIMSDGLNQMCQHSAGMSMMSHGSRVHSCDVLKTLKQCKNRNQERLCIHLVSFCTEDNSREFLGQFLSDHDLEEYYPYYFVGNHIASSDNTAVLDTLIQRIRKNCALNLCKQNAGENNHSCLEGQDTNVSDRTPGCTGSDYAVPDKDIQTAIRQINME